MSSFPKSTSSPPHGHPPNKDASAGSGSLEELREAVEGPLRVPLDAARGAFEGGLCDRCLGRLLGRVGPRGEPGAKGALVRDVLGLAGPVDEQDCNWCEGLFREIDHFAKRALDALEPYGFKTFLVATRMHPDVQALEHKAQAQLEEAGFEVFEPLKMEFNRAVGTRLYETLSVDVDLTRPDAIVQVDPYFDEILVSTSSLYLYGRYRKLVRTIPQTRWPCRSCKGSGCRQCDGTGQRYVDSVESLVAKVPVEAFKAQDSSFHGAGREDIDALMLGTGRPFVLEINGPRHRTPRDGNGEQVSLERLQEMINDHAAGQAEVLDLRWSEKAEVARVKNGTPDKAYRAHVLADAPVTLEALEQAIAKVAGTNIDQRTPNRVAHRRADKVRRRRVHEVMIASFGAPAAPEAASEGTEVDARDVGASTRFSLDIHAAAGTYIKELVSGDEDRTQPSFAGLLGIPMRVEALDVVGVGDPFESA